MSTKPKKPAPASVFSTTYSKRGGGSPASSAASSNSNTNTPATPGTRQGGSQLPHVSSRNSVGSLRSPQGSTVTATLSANAAAWHPTEASRALWQTNPETFAGPVFPASPVAKGSPGPIAGTPADSEKDATGIKSSRSSTNAGPTPPPIAHDVSPTAFPADLGRFKGSRSSLDGEGSSSAQKLENPTNQKKQSLRNNDDDDVVMEFVPLSDKMARSEAEIIAHMIGAHRVGGVGNHSIASNGGSSGADTDDYNEMVEEMDRVHEQIGTPASALGPRRIPRSVSYTGPETFPSLGPSMTHNTEGEAAGDAPKDDGAAVPYTAHPGGSSTNVMMMGGNEDDCEDDDDDFNDYDTQFDDELDEAELDWIESQLVQHSEKLDDPALFF